MTTVEGRTARGSGWASVAAAVGVLALGALAACQGSRADAATMWQGALPTTTATEIAGCAAASLPADTILRDVWIGPAGEVWVVGTGGFVGRRAPGAGSTVFCRPGPTADLQAVWGADGNDVWAVGDGATILHWNGATWATSADTGAPEPGDLRGVWGDVAGSTVTVWVVGDAGVARVFDGRSWQVADADARLTLSGVWVSPSGVVRAVAFAPLPILDGITGEEAVVLVRRTGAWTREATFETDRGVAELRRISGSSDFNIWAAGVKFPSGAVDSFAFVAHFDGTGWTSRTERGLPGGPVGAVVAGRTFLDVAAMPPNATGGAWFAATARPGVLFDGTDWTAPGPRLGAIDVRGSALWAVSLGHDLLHWDGTSWKIVP